MSITALTEAELLSPAWKVTRVFHCGWVELVMTATKPPDTSSPAFVEAVTVQMWIRERPDGPWAAVFSAIVPAGVTRRVVGCNFVNDFGFPSLLRFPVGAEVIAVHSPLSGSYAWGPPTLTVQPHGTFL